MAFHRTPRPRATRYAYRIRGRERGGLVLWELGVGDGPDAVVSVPGPAPRRVPVFTTARRARASERRQGHGRPVPQSALLDLERVQYWLEAPERRRVPAGPVLDAWNFFEDLGRGVGTVALLPVQGEVHNSAYEKLFGGECEAWTGEEASAVRELMAVGVALWNAC
ncbi:hypothetical protein OG897_26485 [Streptomyces sp. NBC_00237]|uniref:hypothetical protein n=1 Tax=Streptomyces sp. NBC_00237 TaxID=2975687 RepID=UPI002253C968|nr:hypothetical protein [Streptomyces sp. NBC_00237]MCX5204991.1 hypothetical protein [Streptomyces sp. NBC_00237]